MKNPKVTVLMSAYNGEKYLQEGIESILNQTFEDFEFLIINDCSTDSSRDLILSYSDPRIRLIDNERNLGLTKSLNHGLKLARGDYIARMDADDISMPERLKEETAYLDARPEVAVVGTGFETIDETGELISSSNAKLTPEAIYYTLLFYNCLAHSTVMFRKGIVISTGGYSEDFLYAQDAELWYRLSRKSRIDLIDEILVKWRNTKSNISNLYKHEQEYSSDTNFIKNIKDAGGNDVKIDDIWCFRNEAFPDRRPIKISLESLLELEKIQSELIGNCPTWLNREILEEYANHKLENYIYLLFLRGKFLTLIRLLSFPRLRRRFINLLRRKIGDLK